jgi:hypothetical protein
MRLRNGEHGYDERIDQLWLGRLVGPQHRGSSELARPPAQEARSSVDRGQRSMLLRRRATRLASSLTGSG